MCLGGRTLVAMGLGGGLLCFVNVDNEVLIVR